MVISVKPVVQDLKKAIVDKIIIFQYRTAQCEQPTWGWLLPPPGGILPLSTRGIACWGRGSPGCIRTSRDPRLSCVVGIAETTQDSYISNF